MKIRQAFDRWLNGNQWWKIGGFMVFTIAVFFMIPGLLSLLLDDSAIPKLWTMYYYYVDPGNQMAELNADSSTSRWIGLIVSTLGSVFLSGLLISTITNIFENRADKWRTGFSYYKLKNHIVIIGSDQMVYGLVNQLCADSEDYIVVMTSSDVEKMRNSLWASLKYKADRKRVIVNYGQRDSANDLEAINVAFAKDVYILGDTSEFDNIENFHDSLNIKCMGLIADLCKKGNDGKLPCHVLFDYKTTYHIFQYADLDPEITAYIDFHPFDFYDFWARKVFVVSHTIEGHIQYKPLDYIPITQRDSERFVHLIVVGMSQMGQALALQAAHIAHFPNYRKKKTKITFIDRDAKVQMGEFKQKCGELFKVSRSTYIDAEAWSMAKDLMNADESSVDMQKFIRHYGLDSEYEHLVRADDPDKEFIDIEWEFIKGDDHNPVVQEILKGYAEDVNAIVTVAICLNITHVSLRSAMHLPKVYYEKEIPILVQQRKTSSIVSTLNGKGLDSDKREKLLYKNIVPFGMVYDCYDLNMISSAIICKGIAYVYDYYDKHNGEFPAEIDDNDADRIWNSRTISKRWSNIFAASSIPTKLRSIGLQQDIETTEQWDDFSDEQIELLAEIEHNRWNVEELLLGYRPVNRSEDEEIDRNKSKKTEYKARFIHYDIRPFDSLKTDEKGNIAAIYDKVIVKSIPLILNYKANLKRTEKI